MKLILLESNPFCTCLFIFLEQLFCRWTAPAPQPSFVLDSFADLARANSHLILQIALLRQQLIILQRQVKRLHFNRLNRFWLLILASRVAKWKQGLLIIQTETLLRWHRQGFRLFWKVKSRARNNQPKIAPEMIDLI